MAAIPPPPGVPGVPPGTPPPPAVPGVPGVPPAPPAAPTNFRELYDRQPNRFPNGYAAYFGQYSFAGPPGPGPYQPNEQLRNLATSENTVPKFLLYVENGVIRSLHRITMKLDPVMNVGPHNGVVFAFRGDLGQGNQIQLMTVPADAFHAGALVTVPTPAEMANAIGALAPGAARVGPFNAGDPNTEQVRARKLFPCPQELWLEVLSQDLSVLDFYALVDQHIIQPGVVGCEELVLWARVAATNTAAGTCALEFGAPVLPSLEDPALTTYKWGLVVADLPALSVTIHNQVQTYVADQQRLGQQITPQQQANNRSTEILDSWCQRLPNVPNINDLRRVVEAPLQKALPSSHAIAVTDRPVADVISTTFSLEDSFIVPELGALRDSIHALQKFGDNEDSVHSLVDGMILSPMSIIGRSTGCPFKINRNGVDSSGATLANLRPDVLVWLPSGVLAFKGEDKATSNEIDAARNELLTKLNCFSDAYFGRVPYQICYASGGSMLEFWAISRHGARPTLTAISTAVDLSTVRGRSLCVRYAVNISRVLLSFQATYPEGSVSRLGETIKTMSSVINILGHYVVKKTRSFTDGDLLTELYSQIQASRAPSLVSLQKDPKVSRGVLTLHIGPVGFCGKTPESVAEVKTAGHRVLSALQWLHDNGWVHRDIRPQNIMFAEGSWYLMDLEWANRIDSGVEDYNPNPKYLPPELVGVQGRPWTAACDMWQFGKLIEHWNQLDKEGHSYVYSQAQEDPERRLSARDSLAHEFFV